MNKIKYITLILLCICANSFGQVLSNAEYFWDTDPGEGNGISFNAADGSFNSGNEGFLLNNISVPSTTGLHVFCVRSKDSNNQWGPVNKQVVDVSNVPLAANAVPTNAQAEYFWDTDPGQGNGIAFAATDGNLDATLETLLQTVTTPAAHGLHTFNARVMDSNSQWGPVNKQVIDVNNSLLGSNAVPTIEAAEYFWDVDPGEGNGIAFSATDGNFNSTVEKFFNDNVAIVNPVGPHVFFTRAKDNSGFWGPVNRQVIVIETVLSVDTHTVADDFFFFPNPASSLIRFNKDIESVSVVDLNGREMTRSVSNNEVNIEGLATGTYILKITTPDGVSFNKKMIKR